MDMCPKIVYIIAAIIVFAGCGGGKDAPTPAPGAVQLSSPADNTACLKSSSGNGASASVTFSWSAGANAENYRVDIKNLNTQSSVSYTTDKLEYTADLQVNVPYSWSVSAINNTGSTTSSVWKFYLSGAASNSYAPFPAELTSPAMGAVINANGAATMQVSLEWRGSDPDNDVAGYAVYLDNTNATTQIIASQTALSSMQNISSGKTYYWKVVTTDKTGNSSVSAIGSFQIR